MVTNNPFGGAQSASAERETKGQREQLGKGTKKKPNGSAASLPGDSRAAPVIYEAGGGGGGRSPLECRQDPHPSTGDADAPRRKVFWVVVWLMGPVMGPRTSKGRPVPHIM